MFVCVMFVCGHLCMLFVCYEGVCMCFSLMCVSLYTWLEISSCFSIPPPLFYFCRAFLNVCYAYTSRHEMTEAIKEMVTGAQDGLLYPR